MPRRSNNPEHRAHSPSSSSTITRESRRSGTAGWQVVFLSFSVAILCSAVAFTVGAIKFYDSNGPKAKENPPALIGDTTFFVLLAQAIPNVMNAILEVVKIRLQTNPCWRSHAIFLGILFIASILSVAAPIVYAVANRTRTWTQVETMILHFCASFLTIISGMTSVFMASRARDDQAYDIEMGRMDRNVVQAQEENRRLKAQVQARGTKRYAFQRVMMPWKVPRVAR